MTVLSFIFPSRRPERLRVTLDSFRFTTATYDVQAIVVADSHEVAEAAQGLASTVITASNITAPQAWNAGAAASDAAAWFGLGADDLYFHDGWLEALWPMLEQHDGGLIGLNDGADSFRRLGWATHFVASHRFCVEHMGGVLVPPVYEHGMVDVETCMVALRRGLFAYCPDALVEHLHPDWGKAEPDALYARDMMADRRLYSVRAMAGFPLAWEPVIHPLPAGGERRKGGRHRTP